MSDPITMHGAGESRHLAALARELTYAAEVTRLRSQRRAVLALHRDAGPSEGYDSSGRYTDLPRCCDTCGTHGEYGVPWPCPTARALGATDE
ncbi:hypothetical protein ACFQE5_01590 [Pseudonocardia hispaniensis]|uniref:Uncharacterized protein n=1 Tax=Pseudonocardia hispaniensis TaxID=904933 RepID=A0ABW1IWT4_9PSEU